MERLAETSGLSLRALVKLEAGEVARPRPDTLKAIADALEAAGVMFINQGEAGPGVRLNAPLPWEDGFVWEPTKRQDR